MKGYDRLVQGKGLQTRGQGEQKGAGLDKEQRPLDLDRPLPQRPMVCSDTLGLCGGERSRLTSGVSCLPADVFVCSRASVSVCCDRKSGGQLQVLRVCFWNLGGIAIDHRA